MERTIWCPHRTHSSVILHNIAGFWKLSNLQINCSKISTRGQSSTILKELSTTTNFDYITCDPFDDSRVFLRETFPYNIWWLNCQNHLVHPKGAQMKVTWHHICSRSKLQPVTRKQTGSCAICRPKHMFHEKRFRLAPKLPNFPLTKCTLKPLYKGRFGSRCSCWLYRGFG